MTAQQPAKPATPAATLSPETEAKARIAELQASVTRIQQQIRSLEGKQANRDPRLMENLKKENAELTQRFTFLKKALFAVIVESFQPRTVDEAKLQYESLRKAVVDYCKKAKVDPELWKSIAS